MKITLKFQYLTSIILYGISGFYLFAQSSLHIDGTYDLNGNGRSELLIYGSKDAPLKYVELDEQGRHELLWAYSTSPTLKITDAKLLDLNKDGIPELLVSVTTLADNGKEKQPWMLVFSWLENSFSSQPLALYNSSGATDRNRPLNLAVQKNSQIIGMSLASPSRKGVLLNLSINEKSINLSSFQAVDPKIITNGFGRVYVGLFSQFAETRLALVCHEGNGLKVSVYSLGENIKEIASDLLILNGARMLQGPAIMAFDQNRDGNEELLLPFQSGEVLALSLEGEKLVLKPSRFNKAGLFSIPADADAGVINKILLKRIEAGLYETPLGKNKITSLDYIPQDTLLLGDTLVHFVLRDSAEEFYGFYWLSSPPPGLVFDPSAAALKWIPTRANIGPAKTIFNLETRVEEKLISSMDELGDRHQITSVLASRIDSASFMVLDTTFIQKQLSPLVYVLPRNYSIGLYSGNISSTDRYVFEGEPPYGMSSAILNDSLLGGVTTTVSANLNSINHDKISNFSFKSRSPQPEKIVTLSLIHDLGENLLYASIYPALDSLPQSFDPRGMSSDLALYPEYFFEGFAQGLSMESGDAEIYFNLDRVRAHEEGLITLTSPLEKDHKFQIYYSGGLPYALRGEVRVMENGTYKTVTEIDFESKFLPIRIQAKFSTSKKDTILFFPDSLEEGASYAPARELLSRGKEAIPIGEEQKTGETLSIPPALDSTAVAIETVKTDSSLVDSLKFPGENAPGRQDILISEPSKPELVETAAETDSTVELISPMVPAPEIFIDESVDTLNNEIPDSVSINIQPLDSLIIPEISDTAAAPDSL